MGTMATTLHNPRGAISTAVNVNGAADEYEWVPRVMHAHTWWYWRLPSGQVKGKDNYYKEKPAKDINWQIKEEKPEEPTNI